LSQRRGSTFARITAGNGRVDHPAGTPARGAIVWLKRYPIGKARVGTGYRVRTMREPILVCAVGNPQHKPFPSTFDGIAREHSRKPDEFYDIVLAHTPHAMRRADLFSRQTRLGFHGWGNEHGKFDRSAALFGAGSG
jgi:N6-adenosine-specific RNA methylase IME4